MSIVKKEMLYEGEVRYFLQMKSLQTDADFGIQRLRKNLIKIDLEEIFEM